MDILGGGGPPPPPPPPDDDYDYDLPVGLNGSFASSLTTGLMAKKSVRVLSPTGLEPRTRNSQNCAYTTVLLHQSALPDTKHYSVQCFMVVAQLQIHPTLRTHIPVKRKRSKS